MHGPAKAGQGKHLLFFSSSPSSICCRRLCASVSPGSTVSALGSSDPSPLSFWVFVLRSPRLAHLSGGPQCCACLPVASLLQAGEVDCSPASLWLAGGRMPLLQAGRLSFEALSVSLASIALLSPRLLLGSGSSDRPSSSNFLCEHRTPCCFQIVGREWHLTFIQHLHTLTLHAFSPRNDP